MADEITSSRPISRRTSRSEAVPLEPAKNIARRDYLALVILAIMLFFNFLVMAGAGWFVFTSWSDLQRSQEINEAHRQVK
jgi:hypothetical protein